MRQDVLTLSRFYKSPLGVAAKAMILRRIAALWRPAKDLDLLGVGYAAPYLDYLAQGARRAVAAMPAVQGVTPWVGEDGQRATLCPEDGLPFLDCVFDRAIAAHALEESANPAALLAELWRVLAPQGRVVLAVASRRGLWARVDSSPFGHGRPFSRAQIAQLLRAARLEPQAWARALYMPPAPWRALTDAVGTWEAVGERIAPRFGGVILVEAVKRQHALIEDPVRKPVFAAAPAAAPAGVMPRGRSQSVEISRTFD
ncbi:MAG: class I SAM-dependent methyltransferase [Maricaulaceae bacterium]